MTTLAPIVAVAITIRHDIASRTLGYGGSSTTNVKRGKNHKLWAQRAKMAIQLFQPDAHTVYTIETAVQVAQMSRRMILVYCKHGLISPVAELTKHGYYFNGDTVRSLRRIQNLRTIDGLNLAGIKLF